MFEQVVESLRKATEANLAIQQEMIRKWIGLWPTNPVLNGGGVEQVQRDQKQWADFIQEVLRRQREATQAQFRTGLDVIDKTFQFAEVKTPEEMRTRTMELWRQCFEALRQSADVQAREYQQAVEKWFEMINKVPA